MDILNFWYVLYGGKTLSKTEKWLILCILWYSDVKFMWMLVRIWSMWLHIYGYIKSRYLVVFIAGNIYRGKQACYVRLIWNNWLLTLIWRLLPLAVQHIVDTCYVSARVAWLKLCCLSLHCLRFSSTHGMCYSTSMV